MITPALPPSVDQTCWFLPSAYIEPRWYAAYTRARHEKRVAQQLQGKFVETLLPVYETVHHWRNGRARVVLPLFPGYVFVRIPLKDRMKVLEVPSVVHLVGFNGQPAALPDAEIETLRSRLTNQVQAEPRPYLTTGRRVHIKAGPLAGVEGILMRRKQKYRLVLSVDLIKCSIAAEVDIADVEAAL
jgi:transcription termination/antitermination protein NusG